MLDFTKYDLVMLDFDGTLVDTESFHYRAYLKMCEQRGFELPWDFSRYTEAAHKDASALELQIYEALPGLKEQEPSWSVLYDEKKSAYLALLEERPLQLMAGAKKLLETLKELGIAHCVVTHSPQEQIALIRSKLPLLGSIPHWFVRGDYTKPKPDPESYLMAIEKLSKGGAVIGFEDMPKGLKALMQTPAEAYLVCDREYPELAAYEGQFKRINSLKELFV